MRKIFFLALVLACISSLFVSCEKDGGSGPSYLDGTYDIQQLDAQMTMLLNGTDRTSSRILIDFEKKTIKYFENGKETSGLSWLIPEEQFWSSEIKYLAEEDPYGFQLCYAFQKNGKVQFVHPRSYYESIAGDYWDPDIFVELDDNIYYNYSIEKSILTFSVMALEGRYSYKITANSGNSLELEHTKSSLAVLNENLSDESPAQVTFEYCRATYARQ